MRTKGIIQITAMKSSSGRRAGRRSERGTTLIELMISVVVLTVGMLGSMLLIIVALQSNSRNKTDTTATVLNNEILESFATLKKFPKPAGFVNVYDCGLTGSNQYEASIASGAGPNGAGAALYTTSTAPSPEKANDIDWTQPAPTLASAGTPGYAINYRTCSGDQYQVRWNILNIDTRLTMLTVSTRQMSAMSADSAGSLNRAVLYSQPTTLHALVESEQ